MTFIIGTAVSSMPVRSRMLDPRQNAKGATVHVGDARELPMADASVDACVSNLPFGQKYEVQGGMENWLKAVLAELGRVTRPGGRVVLLAPRIPRGAIPVAVAQAHRFPIRLLGMKTTVWAYDRRCSMPAASSRATRWPG